MKDYVKSPPEFEWKEDSSTIDSIKKRIRDIEYAILHTRKTSRVRQNEKNLIQANSKLKSTIYQHNKYRLFDTVSEAMNHMMSNYIEKRMDDFAEVSDIHLGDTVEINTSLMNIDSSKITTYYNEYPKRTYIESNSLPQELFNKGE